MSTQLNFLTTLLTEVTYKTSRSSGKGGQNVNKVSSKVELMFDIPNSALLSTEQKERLLTKLKNKVSTEGILRLTEETDRAQLKNKELIQKKFKATIKTALTIPKKRKPTKPSEESKTKRLEEKKQKSTIKKLRRQNPLD